MGASRHSEAGAAVSEQPEKARKKPRLMTDEERAEHTKEQSRQRTQKRRNNLRTARHLVVLLQLVRALPMVLVRVAMERCDVLRVKVRGEASVRDQLKGRSIGQGALS